MTDYKKELESILREAKRLFKKGTVGEEQITVPLEEALAKIVDWNCCFCQKTFYLTGTNPPAACPYCGERPLKESAITICNRCKANLCEHENCTDWTCARACSKCAPSPVGVGESSPAGLHISRERLKERILADPDEEESSPASDKDAQHENNEDRQRSGVVMHSSSLEKSSNSQEPSRTLSIPVTERESSPVVGATEEGAGSGDKTYICNNGHTCEAVAHSKYDGPPQHCPECGSIWMKALGTPQYFLDGNPNIKKAEDNWLRAQSTGPEPPAAREKWEWSYHASSGKISGIFCGQRSPEPYVAVVRHPSDGSQPYLDISPEDAEKLLASRSPAPLSEGKLEPPAARSALKDVLSKWKKFASENEDPELGDILAEIELAPAPLSESSEQFDVTRAAKHLHDLTKVSQAIFGPGEKTIKPEGLEHSTPEPQSLQQKSTKGSEK